MDQGQETYSGACWLDGLECPYGKPNGQFLLKPRSFCFMPEEGGAGSRGCAKIYDNKNGLLEFFKIHIEAIRASLIDPNDLESVSSKKSKRLSEIIAKTANRYGKTERETLELAEEILAREEDDDEKNPEVIMSSEIDALL